MDKGGKDHDLDHVHDRDHNENDYLDLDSGSKKCLQIGLGEEFTGPK